MLISTFINSYTPWITNGNTNKSFNPKPDAQLKSACDELQQAVQLIPGPVSHKHIETIKESALTIKNKIEGSCTLRKRALEPDLNPNLAIMQTAYEKLVNGLQPFSASPTEIAGTQIIVKEIEDMREIITNKLVENAEKFLNIHDVVSGIWYSEEFEKVFEKICGRPIHIDYFSGYADPKFFRKTEHFTYELKEGKRPSEALMNFLKGPKTVVGL